MSALVGIGSYAATYRALTLVSQPSQGIGIGRPGPHGRYGDDAAPPTHQFP